MPEPVLSIRDMTVEFGTEDGVVKAVTGVNYDLFPGEILGVIGESGAGKSVSVMTMLDLIPKPPGRVVSGEAIFKGRDLLTMSKRELRDVRGGDIAMIFQDPMTSLNPVLKVGTQIAEAVLAHNPKASDDDARNRAVELLALVGVPNPEQRCRPVPARVLRRHASARDDRDGDRELAVRPHRRRADDGARRDDPGADRRGDEDRAA